MKKYIILLLLSCGILITESVYSQNFDSYKKSDRKEKKAEREAYLNANFRAIDTLLQKRAFVIEADFLNDQYGNRVPVTSNINFIQVNSNNVVLQTGINGSVGTNGVGGTTAEGTINNWKVSKDEKRKTFTVSFNTMTNIGTYDVFLTIGADNNARATITGLVPGSLTYTGYLVALYNSKVFKGLRTN